MPLGFSCVGDCQLSFQTLARLVMKKWTWLLLLGVLTVSMATGQREVNGQRCPDSMMQEFSSYKRRIYRYVDKMYFGSPALKERQPLKTPDFKKKLFNDFRLLDTNQNGRLDGEESVSLFNRLWSLRRCVPQFITLCDADRDSRVSPKEWMTCFGEEKCNKSCPQSKIDQLLCVCLCNTTIEGLVRSYKLGVPLQNASVLLQHSVLDTRLVMTNSSGHYKMRIDTCHGDISMTINKKGYSAVRLDMAAVKDKWYRDIEMKDVELPSVVIHPRSRRQQRGGNVTLKCQAEGDLPMRIEWYHNGVRLRETTFGTSSVLFIPNVDKKAGLYKCRAVNQHGSENSQAAELTVIEPTEDSCSSIPIVSSVRLPAGCINPNTGNDVLNVGRCSNEQCIGRKRSSVTSGVCQDENCCCGPLYTETAEVVCMGVYRIKMTRVIKCGCGKCEKHETVVKGLVVGGPDEIPARRLNVVVNGKLLATTDQQGTFQIVVPHELKRLIITFKDRSKRYADTTVVVPFEKGRTVFHKINVNIEDPPVEFQTSEKLTVPLGHTRDGSAVAELEVPANSFVTPHGKLYRGQVRLRLSFTNPRNESDILSAPGDFSTVDEMGNVQPLKSYGMIRMSFEDDENRELGLTNNVKIYIDAEKLSNFEYKKHRPAPRLWWLDEKTGRWRDAEPIKPVDDNDPKRGRRATGRKFLVGEIETDKHKVINIDVPWQLCFIRVETLVNKSTDPEPAEGVEIRVIGQDVKEQFYYGYTKAFTGPNGVSCLPVWCNASGFIQAEKNEFTLTEEGEIRKSGIPLVPDVSNLLTLPVQSKASVKSGNEISSVHFTAFVKGINGPVFASDDFTKCRYSKHGMKSFRFVQEIEGETATEHFNVRYPPGHKLAWYSGGDSPNIAIHKCFLKVNIESIVEPNIMLESFTADAEARFGFTVETATKSKLLRDEFGSRLYTTCLEYRCSEPGKSTTLRLTLISDSCYMFRLSPKLLDAQVKIIRENELQVEFTASEGKFGKNFGMYAGQGTRAEDRCYAGSHDRSAGLVPWNFDGHAVLVTQGLECPHISDYEVFQ